MSTSDPVVIVSAVRTPLGRFQGDLSSFSAHNLGSHAIGAALERRADGVRAKIVRAERRQVALKAAKGSADSGYDDNGIGRRHATLLVRARSSAVLDDMHHMKRCGNSNPRDDNKSMNHMRTSSPTFKTCRGMPQA